MAKEIAQDVSTVEIDPNKVYAQLVLEDGVYYVIDETHGKQACKLSDDGVAIALPTNDSNRKWQNVARMGEGIQNGEAFDLYYKASKVFGPVGTKLPNSKLIAYLSEEDQAEYKAIIDRARAAKAADKKQPKSEKEKLEAKIAKLQAEIAELEEE